MNLLGPGHVVHLPRGKRIETGAGKLLLLRPARGAGSARSLAGGDILAEADSGQRQVAAAQRHHLHDDVVPATTTKFSKKTLANKRKQELYR